MNQNFEKQFLENFESILFCDEVGRGPIAGPVVACSVIFHNSKDTPAINKKLIELGIDDSKKLSTKKRKSILESLNIDFSTLKVDQIYKMKDWSFVIKDKSHLGKWMQEVELKVEVKIPTKKTTKKSKK